MPLHRSYAYRSIVCFGDSYIEGYGGHAPGQWQDAPKWTSPCRVYLVLFDTDVINDPGKGGQKGENENGSNAGSESQGSPKTHR